jgi:hypothetical protein
VKKVFYGSFKAGDRVKKAGNGSFKTYFGVFTIREWGEKNLFWGVSSLKWGEKSFKWVV